MAKSELNCVCARNLHCATDTVEAGGRAGAQFLVATLGRLPDQTFEAASIAAGADKYVVMIRPIPVHKISTRRRRCHRCTRLCPVSRLDMHMKRDADPDRRRPPVGSTVRSLAIQFLFLCDKGPCCPPRAHRSRPDARTPSRSPSLAGHTREEWRFDFCIKARVYVRAYRSSVHFARRTIGMPCMLPPHVQIADQAVDSHPVIVRDSAPFSVRPRGSVSALAFDKDIRLANHICVRHRELVLRIT